MPRRSEESDFWRRLALDDETDCWNFVGKANTSGYGHVMYQGHKWLTHRLAYVLVYGPPPADEPQVNHSCHNRLCCNPDHLHSGTHVTNSLEMVLAGRQATLANGKKHRFINVNVPRGERSGRAKLSDEKVREMRRLAPTLPIFGRWAALGRQFGVTDVAARLVVLGRVWKHIPLEG